MHDGQTRSLSRALCRRPHGGSVLAPQQRLLASGRRQRQCGEQAGRVDQSETRFEGKIRVGLRARLCVAKPSTYPDANPRQRGGASPFPAGVWGSACIVGRWEVFNAQSMPPPGLWRQRSCCSPSVLLSASSNALLNLPPPQSPTSWSGRVHVRLVVLIRPLVGAAFLHCLAETPTLLLLSL